MAFPTAPQYDNIRWAGKNTPRIPVEVGGGTLALIVQKTIDRGSGSASITLSLVPYATATLGGEEASYIIVTNTGSGTGATILEISAAIPGHQYIVYNNTGQGKTVTLRVKGQTGIAVADGTRALLVCDSTDITSVVQGQGPNGPVPQQTVYTGTTDAVLFPGAYTVAVFTSTGPDAATLAVPGAADVGKTLVLINTNTTQTTVTTTANKILNGTATPGDTLTAPAHAGAVVVLYATNGFWNICPGGAGTWVLSEV